MSVSETYNAPTGFFTKSLEEVDGDVFASVTREFDRQQKQIELNRF